MFIERSAGRIRLARFVFVAVGLLPCLAVVGWAAYLGSAVHRDAVRGSWEKVVGLPLEIGAIDHPRPGVVRASRWSIVTAAGGRRLELPTVEIESAAHEDRIRIDRARVDAPTAAVLAGLGREWLQGDVRHPRNCVVEVADFGWSSDGLIEAGAEAGGQPQSPIPVRIECVARGKTRAIRVVRRAAVEDELRIVRAVDDADGRGAERIEVDATWSDAIPLAILTAAAGWDGGSIVAVGGSATAAGEVHTSRDGDGWDGIARGRLLGIDLRPCAERVKASASGTATIIVDRLAWRDGRLDDAVIECLTTAGWVDAALFDRLVIALGCKPGPAAATSGAMPTRAFDAAGCVLRLHDGQLDLQPSPAVPGGLASTGGVPLLQPPTVAVPFDRLAWMLSPPAATFVPAAGPGAWLMSILPPRTSLPPTAEGRTTNSAAREGNRGF
jgi:hypothetical protein